MQHSTTGEDAIVYRGGPATHSDRCSPTSVGPPLTLWGRIIQDRAFVSTSMSTHVLPDFADEVTMRIEVSAGTHAIHADDVSAYSGREYELLLDRRLDMVITGVRTGSRGELEIDLQILK